MNSSGGKHEISGNVLWWRLWIQKTTTVLWPLLLEISLAPTGFYGRLAGRGLASLTENATGSCVNRLRQWYLSDCLMFE